jgi:GT2 family glycosyltransferase
MPDLQSPVQSAGAVPQIRLVCATRLSSDEFFKTAPLGRSLRHYRTFPQHQRIELRLFSDNREGLPGLYNRAIDEAARDPAVLVFLHDDVHLSDFYWASRVHEGLHAFDVIGLAGNRRRLPAQPSWIHVNAAMERDDFANLSGVLGHGTGFPELTELSVYGVPGQEVKLLDGVLLAVHSDVLQRSGVRFDARFRFNFYDMDFCRQAERAGLRMGTWGISLVHESAGAFRSADWSSAYESYLNKYGE